MTSQEEAQLFAQASSGKNPAALESLQVAANNGYAVAQFNLGAVYANGQGVPQNYAIAYALFNLAAVGDTKDSINRDSISQQMTEAAIESGQNLTRMMQSLGVTAAINAYSSK
ncbi:hypothetical protein [Acidocella sp.]|uniref:hypothetical protein n=1 Tax=Acidocella sp. TaxID=50710 RepID=UPI001845633C|nr:hypothetical protein [Acidocella sp.]NNM57820.1 sel1 repeat family protein [Acidocella sp.]